MPFSLVRALRHVAVLRALIVVLAFTPGTAVAASKFEPPDGQAYFGFTTRSWDGPALTDPSFGDERPFRDRYADSIASELGGKSPTLFGVPTIWQNADGSMVPFSDAAAIIAQHTAVDPAGVPVITWNAHTGWGAGDASYAGMTTKTVAGGSLDAYVHQYARDVKAYGRPVFIRPLCGEVNGNWWRNCSPGANAALTKADYVAAWRRVVDIFRQEQADNVAWVWNVNTFPPAPNAWGIDSDLAGYYPGDTYVDWTGADHYDYGDPATTTNPLTPASYLDAPYAFAAQHGKPFFVAEWGVRHAGAKLTPDQQQQFLTGMFDYFAGHPRVKAALYFNYNSSDRTGQPSAGSLWLYDGLVNYVPFVSNGDSRLLAGSGVDLRGTFAGRILDGRYTSQLSVDQTAPALSAIAVSSIADTAATVVWSTDEPASTVVEYGTTTAYGQTATGSADVTSHSLRLTGLSSSTTYHYRVRSLDGSGNGAVSGDATFTTTGDTVTPQVTITAPANNAKVTKNATTTIKADATDNRGVTKVEFSVNGAVTCTDTSAPYSCAWAVPKTANTTYRIVAAAYDAAGNKGTSGTVTVTAK
jgi:chitodextrinase